MISAFLLVASVPQDKVDRQTESLLDEAFTLYMQGEGKSRVDPKVTNYEESYKKFEEALQRKPSTETVIHWINKVGKDEVAKIVNTPYKLTNENMTKEEIEDIKKFNAVIDNIRGVGSRLFELAKPGDYYEAEATLILKYIQDLFSKEIEVYNLSFVHLRNYGSYAMKFLMAYLNDKSEETRSRVIYLITKIGRRATLALIEGLKSNTLLIKQNSAIILGNIQDERAIPALKRVVEDAKESEEVRKKAEEALESITRLPKSEWKKASEYYVDLAKKYYYSQSSVLPLWDRTFLIWKWDTDKDVITERKVAGFAFNEQLAEDALYTSLELDPSYELAWQYLVLNSLAQILETESAFKQAITSLDFGEITNEQFEDLLRKFFPKEQFETSIKQLLTDKKYDEVRSKIFESVLKFIGAIGGRKHLYGALAIALKDKDYPIGAQCLEFWKQLGKSDDIPPHGERFFKTKYAGYPIVDALTCDDKRVRYAAAETVLKLCPREKKLGHEFVIANLTDAMSEMSVTTALVIYEEKIEEDISRINIIKSTLFGSGVLTSFGRDEVEGLIKANGYPAHDIILLQYKLASKVRLVLDTRGERKENVFDSLRDDVRTKHIPKFIICDTEKEMEDAKKLFGGHAQQFIMYNVDKVGLKGLIDKTFPSDQKKQEFKGRAVQLARKAVEAVSTIEPETTVYPYKLCIPILLRLVDPDQPIDESVRIPALKALGVLADKSVIEKMLKLSGKNESKAIRLMLIRSLGNIFKKENLTPEKDLMDSLKMLLQDGDYDIELATAEAIGNLALTDAQRSELARAKRPKRESFTPDELKEPKPK